MDKMIRMLGNVAGGLGLVACAVGGLFRLMGVYDLGGIEPMTVFQGGLGLMVAGCLFKIHALEAR